MQLLLDFRGDFMIEQSMFLCQWHEIFHSHYVLGAFIGYKVKVEILFVTKNEFKLRVLEYFHLRHIFLALVDSLDFWHLKSWDLFVLVIDHVIYLTIRISAFSEPVHFIIQEKTRFYLTRPMHLFSIPTKLSFREHTTMYTINLLVSFLA